jgi:hypothetical protein
VNRRNFAGLFNTRRDGEAGEVRNPIMEQRLVKKEARGGAETRSPLRRREVSAVARFRTRLGTRGPRRSSRMNLAVTPAIPSNNEATNRRQIFNKMSIFAIPW